MTRPINHVKQWVVKAEEDESAGIAILKNTKHPAPACFHFQQMAEKYLKALLVSNKKEFPKTHDLVGLAGLIIPSVPDIEKCRKDIETLNKFSVAVRYPGDVEESPTPRDAQKAYVAASRVKKFVQEKL